MKKNIAAALFLTALVFTIMAMAVFKGSAKQRGSIQSLHIEGAAMLNADEYIKFTGMNDLTDSITANLNLAIVRDRFVKHPYIKDAALEQKADGALYIYLAEKNVKAYLTADNDTYFLTEMMEVIPIMPETKELDYPVITYSSVRQPREFNHIDSADIVEAFKIIDAAGLISEELSNGLSDINLRRGEEAVLSFNFLEPPVLFGNYNTTEKLLYIDKIRKNLNSYAEMLENSTYIDVRYENQIIIGKEVKSGEEVNE